MSAKNFIIENYNGTDYDILYPQTNTEQVLLDKSAQNLTSLESGKNVDDALNKITKDGGGMRVGDILLSAKQNLGNKWLLCNGATISEQEYPELVNALSIKPSLANTNQPFTGSFYAIMNEAGDIATALNKTSNIASTIVSLSKQPYSSAVESIIETKNSFAYNEEDKCYYITDKTKNIVYKLTDDDFTSATPTSIAVTSPDNIDDYSVYCFNGNVFFFNFTTSEDTHRGNIIIKYLDKSNNTIKSFANLSIIEAASSLYCNFGAYILMTEEGYILTSNSTKLSAPGTNYIGKCIGLQADSIDVSAAPVTLTQLYYHNIASSSETLPSNWMKHGESYWCISDNHVVKLNKGKVTQQIFPIDDAATKKIVALFHMGETAALAITTRESASTDIYTISDDFTNMTYEATLSFGFNRVLQNKDTSKVVFTDGSGHLYTVTFGSNVLPTVSGFNGAYAYIKAKS